MHELAIAHSLVQSAAEHAIRHGATRVVRVDVVLGMLAGVQADSLTFCFPLAAEETVCAGAELHITLAPGLGRCGACGQQAEVEELMAPCPACGHWPLEVTGGGEMTLRSVEVT